MTRLAYALAASLLFTGCLTADDDGAEDIALSETEDGVMAAAADGASWEAGATLHVGTHETDGVGASERRSHSIWVKGTTAKPVPLLVTAKATAGNDVRITVLGPLVNGTRPVLGADGYTSKKRSVSVALKVKTSGELLVVVGSYKLAHETFYDVAASCTAASGCGTARFDALATPKEGALVGSSARTVSVKLGDALASRSGLNVELWASPPMQSWNAAKVATASISGATANVSVPASVKEGDDLRLVVTDAAGAVLDSGVTTRFATSQKNLVRLDAILYGDIASLDVAGVVGYFEGVVDMRLRKESTKVYLAKHVIKTDRPGQVGMGFSSFDASFHPALTAAPHDGDVLSVGFINANGNYQRLGCFEYCNNLSGASSCTGGARTCN